MTLRPHPFVYSNFAQVPEDEFKARWPDFSPREIATRGTAANGAGSVSINFEAMDKLQALRSRLGSPLIVNSAYRTPAHNAAVDGAPGSKHLTAEAFDISMSNHNPQEFEAAAREVGFRGFGFYPRSNFMHVDIGPARSWGERFPETTTGLPTEREAAPEALSQDRDAKASVIGGGSVMAGAVALIPALGALSPVAQVIAVGAFIVGFAALAVIFRNRIKKLAQ